MSSPQESARKGKEARDAALASGDLLPHPYKLPRFQPKKIKGVKRSPVVPGSAVEEEMMEECRKFIRWMLRSECSSRQNSGYVTKCDCRKDIRAQDIDFGARAMVNYYIMSPEGRDMKVQDQILRGKLSKKRQRYKKLGNKRKRKEVTRMTGKIFLLFYTYRRVRRIRLAHRVQCCLSTLLLFYNIPWHRFKKIEKDLANGETATPIHASTGKASNNAMKESTIKRLHDFFSALEEEAEPHATKVVRTRARVALRDDDEIVELPSSYSKRGLYAKLMLEWGWTVMCDGRGNYGKLSDYEARAYGDDWVEGVDEAVSPISFATFLKFWSVHYAKLKIRSPSYDTCVLCFKFSCSLSAIVRSANDANIELGNVVLDELQPNSNSGKNGEEEADEILISMSKDAIREEEEETSEDASSSEEEQDEGSVEDQEEEDSESDESSSESNSDSEEDEEGLNMKHEELVRQMHEHFQM